MEDELIIEPSDELDNESDYDDDMFDDDCPCNTCSVKDWCDHWEAMFCCTRCHWAGCDDCDNCDPMDI